MSDSVRVHVEADSEAMGQRFIDAWHRAERGDVAAEAHLSFESWDNLVGVLTGKRLALIRHLHRHPARTIAELARALGRDYKRVHEDVETLAAVGLLDRSAQGLRADYEEIRTKIAI
jgi:predicted transcriptional regulator